MRPRNTREKSLPYKSKELKHLRVAVQSLALVTKQEQVEEVLEAKEISTPDNGWKKDIEAPAGGYVNAAGAVNNVAARKHNNRETLEAEAFNIIAARPHASRDALEADDDTTGEISSDLYCASWCDIEK